MTKLLVGPANYAQQAYEWANAVARSGMPATSVAFAERPALARPRTTSLDLLADIRLPHPSLTTARGRRRRFERLAQNTTHLALDGFAPLLGSHRRPLTMSELSRIRTHFDAMALVAHGSEIRDPATHRARIPDSYFSFLPAEFVDALDARASHNRALAATSLLPILVSTPDLLLEIPTATWLPVVVDSTWFRVPPRREVLRRPRVLHVPSSGAIKGSTTIDPHLMRWAAEGRIEYVRPERVPHRAMATLVRSSDIVVDQVRMGSYGVAAVEAMAAGRVVVGHVSEDVRALVAEEIPIFDAPASDFVDQFENLLQRSRDWPEISAASRAYAQRWHDGKVSAVALRDALRLG